MSSDSKANSDKARAVRSKFESEMTDPANKVTGLVRQFLVPRHNAIHDHYQKLGECHPWALAANHCSEILVDAKSDVIELLAERLGKDANVSSGGRSKLNQAVASNSGKMFERFTAYAISKSLDETNWAIWKDRKDIKDVLGVSKKDFLGISRSVFGKTLEIELEADYVGFHAARPFDHPIILFNCKTSMKERLHQATMWAMLLKIIADAEVRKKFSIDTKSEALHKNCKYALVSGDFALEQPDLRGEPRKLLEFDFSFFDFAFAAITEAWNAHLPKTFSTTDERKQLYRLSALRDVLISLECRGDA